MLIMNWLLNSMGRKYIAASFRYDDATKALWDFIELEATHAQKRNNYRIFKLKRDFLMVIKKGNYWIHTRRSINREPQCRIQSLMG